MIRSKHEKKLMKGEISNIQPVKLNRLQHLKMSYYLFLILGGAIVKVFDKPFIIQSNKLHEFKLLPPIDSHSHSHPLLHSDKLNRLSWFFKIDETQQQNLCGFITSQIELKSLQIDYFYFRNSKFFKTAQFLNQRLNKLLTKQNIRIRQEAGKNVFFDACTVEDFCRATEHPQNLSAQELKLNVGSLHSSLHMNSIVSQIVSKFPNLASFTIDMFEGVRSVSKYFADCSIVFKPLKMLTNLRKLDLDKYSQLNDITIPSLESWSIRIFDLSAPQTFDSIKKFIGRHRGLHELRVDYEIDELSYLNHIFALYHYAFKKLDNLMHFNSKFRKNHFDGDPDDVKNNNSHWNH